ncbi:MAG: HAD family hydrolase [Gammaproteobacteria bacterium]
MSIKSLLFDFDGLILDTETPEADAWEAIYAEHGFEFPMDRWGQIIGGGGLSNFDAAQHLTELARDGLDALSLRARHKAENDALILLQPVLPGVVDLLDEARRLDLRLAVASSSPHSWVDTHLARLGLFDRFDKIVCAEDVPPGRTKPNPDLFLKALEAFNLKPHEAIVFEDSPNGVTAARAAGIFVVVVPNPTTARLQAAGGANLTIPSLEAVSLDDLLRRPS